MMIDDVLTELQGDATLAGLLPGGMYAETEISRQNTPDAFDANQEVLPCLALRIESETQSGVYNQAGSVGVRTYLVGYLYQRYGYDKINAAREQMFTLLDHAKIGTRVWEIEWVDDLPNLEDPGLNCSMCVSRYQAMRRR
jgi:hypothetical protein